MSGKGAKGLSGSGKGAKGTMGDKKGDKKKPVSRSARAGLQFPVGRIHRLLKVQAPAAGLENMAFVCCCCCCYGQAGVQIQDFAPLALARI